ncbi:hypothetical protein B0A49_06060 [Cryomyces minteri]|uniref:DUF4048 domain-containing protein n=1 Tax=Cryomyces minteri TaxID=331657 RepID=A0A4U0X878_9PEZI|nr:hypothetical protein B0A49_06060 [Cryomyces minteri]
MSLTESPQKKNGSSVSFAVQATRNGSPQRRALAPSHIDNLKVARENTASPTGPTDTCFLTALAAQERRVLELKEELHRAELDLQRLKKRWASHEATTKRNDVLRVQQLRPLETATLNIEYTEDDSDGSSAWLQKEMERRKALLSGAKSSHRKVFSGSRNTRALSLLSPDQAAPNPPCPQRYQDRPKRPTPISRTSTTSDLTAELADALRDSNDDRSMPREDLLRTGKQMATDFKDGLWTFIEDLRQATVGDEGVNGMQPTYHDENKFQFWTTYKARYADKTKRRRSLNRHWRLILEREWVGCTKASGGTEDHQGDQAVAIIETVISSVYQLNWKLGCPADKYQLERRHASSTRFDKR